MSRRASPSTSRAYGILRVARFWGIARATLSTSPMRAAGFQATAWSGRPMPDEALVEAIRALLAASPFHGEGHRKIWARLRFAGVRTAKRRVLRLMRAHDLLAPNRIGRPHGPKAHDGTIRTERVDEMWGTDLTSTMTGEGQASIFVTVDHCSTECVGIHAARRATRFEALEPLRQGVRTAFGSFAGGIAGGLKLRHDHGSQFVADDYQRELAFLGIESSPAFVREPEGNGCVERFIRTLKENLLWVRRFDTIEELRVALHRFQEIYNQTWIVERHGYQTPAAIRAAQLAPLPAADNRQRGVSQLWTATTSMLICGQVWSATSSVNSMTRPMRCRMGATGSTRPNSTPWWQGSRVFEPRTSTGGNVSQRLKPRSTLLENA